MIELASAAWRIDIEATVLKLAAYGFTNLPTAHDDIIRYQEAHIDRRRRLLEFWESARRELTTSPLPAYEELLQRLRWGSPRNADLWLDRVGRYIGATTRDAFESVVQPGEHAWKPYGHSTRIFKGPGWKELLMVPFSDLPGRLSGAMLVGRGGSRKDGDILFWPFLKARSDNRPEPGVAMLDTLLEPQDAQLGDSVVVLPDAAAAVRLQARWAASNLRPLPILGLFNASEQYLPLSVWNDMPRRDYVLVAPGAQPSVLAQAAKAGCRVATNRTAKRDLTKFAIDNDPRSFVKKVLRSAKAWQDVLSAEILRLDQYGVEELLWRMRMSDDTTNAFLSTCDHEVRERIEMVRRKCPLNRSVVVGNRHIYQTELGWEVAHRKPKATVKTHRTDELLHEVICDASVRLDKLVTTRGGEAYYRGAVLYRGREFPFFEPAEPLDDSMLKWCCGFLRRHKVDIAYNHRWSRTGSTIAKKFNPPQCVEGLDRVGWDEEHGLFAFPQFALRSNGQVTADHEVVPSGTVVPATNLKPPTSLTAAEKEILAEPGPATSLAWAFTLGVLHNVLAPALTVESYGIAVQGDGAESLGRLCLPLLGCPMPPDNLSTRGADKMHRLCTQHGWPVGFLQLPAERIHEWLLTHSDRNCVIKTSRVGAFALRLRGRWLVVASDEQLYDLRGLNRVLNKLVPAYLGDLCSRRLLLPKGPTIKVLYHDVVDWFARCGGDASGVEAGGAIILPDEDGWSAFVDLLAELVYAGNVGMARKGFEVERQPGVTYITTDADRDVALIPQTGLNGLLARHAAPPVDATIVAKRLGDKLAGQERYQGELHWAVPAAWLNEQLRRRDPAQPNLRLA